MRRKIALTAILFSGLMLFTTCELLPPELQLAFSLDNYDPFDVVNHELTVYYTMENIGDIDLENCKLLFEFDTNIGYIQSWTPGEDLISGDSVSTAYDYYLSGVTTVNDVLLIGAGWDNPPDD